jgi:UDP-N-acetylglucosamine 2-epimerase (non-hydrolysing)
MTDVAHVLGARPNFMKAAPVFHELRSRFSSARQIVVHTGQHYDHVMWSVFLEELGLPAPEYVLGVGSGGHGMQVGRALERLEPILEQERPRLVVVVGDVNSTLAGALAAVQLGIPVAHVEAGLRNFDRNMPEEINRVLVDQVSAWCFTHSPEAEDNLRREGIEPERIHAVGNTMIDTLVRLRPRIDESDVHERLGLRRGEYVLVTLHRPAIVDGALLGRALASLEVVARELPVVFPVHPRTRARLGDLPTSPGLSLVEPLGYLDFLSLESAAAAVVTDSGGIQEETTFLRVPCFTLRETTERPITVTQGTNRVLGLDVERIEDVPRLLEETAVPLALPAGWDGRAAERIVDVLRPALTESEARPSAASAAP